MSADLAAAHAAMQAAPEDEGARRRWYGALLDADLVVLLTREAADGCLDPRLLPLPEGPAVLAFDAEEKLAEALGPGAGAVPVAVLPGRVLVAALAGQGAGLGVNLGATGTFLMGAAAVDWLAGVLAAAPEPAALPDAADLAPADVPEALLAALEARLPRAAGLAERAFLAARGGRPVLVFTGARDPAALARMAAEAAAFCGAPAALDAGFLPAGTPAPATVRRVWDLSSPPSGLPDVAPAPGRAGPPRLR